MQTDHDSQPGLRPQGDRTPCLDRIVVLVATAGLLLARIPAIPIRFFDPDEFEHAHAAWSVFRGLLPYKDFFEHHTPWYYFLLAPFFALFDVDQSFDKASHFLFFARGLSLALTALTVVLMVRLGRLAGGGKVGIFAGLLLLAQPVVGQKTLEIRPDVLALPFFVAALWSLLRGLRDERSSARTSLRAFLAAGLCLGGAIMCTQKMLFVLPGAVAGLGLWAVSERQRAWRPRTAAIAVLLLGVAVPVALTWLGFALRGGGTQFIYNNFLLNAKWRVRSDEHLTLVLRTCWPVLLLGLLGATVRLYRFRCSEQRDFGDVLLLGILGGLVAGIVIVPAAYRQYYLPLLAIVAVYAAIGLLFAINLARERARTWLLIGATLSVLIWPVADVVSSFTEHDERQMARLRYVFAHTRPSDEVMDGWMGTQVFRPHPFYFFFMHGELFPMLSQADVSAIVDALESGRVRPALITLDSEIAALGSRFVRFVLKNYRSDDGLLYLRKPERAQP